MSTFITIELINFKFWYNKTIKLVEGINFMSGESGSGKSTITKSIYFALYGGRKFKSIQHRDHKTEPTKVTIFYSSPIKQWRITRVRPSETITVETQDINGYFSYIGDAAQDWINRQFGIENIWLSASFISRKKPHFLIDASNSDKMELLQHIAYGDSSPHNQPDYYLSIVKAQILIYNEKFKQYNDNIRIYQGIRFSLFNKNPNLSIHPYISEDEMNKLIEQKGAESITFEQLRTTMIALKSKSQLKNQMTNLPIFDRNPEDITQDLELLYKKQKKYKLKEKLVNFDVAVITSNMSQLETDHFLYTRYQKEGWLPNLNLSDWLLEIKNRMDLWRNQQKLEIKNKEIEESNRKKTELNAALDKAYKKQITDYNNIKDEIEKYHKSKYVLDVKMKEMESNPSIKLDDKDDMSSQWLISFKTTLTMSLSEMICPSCNHGLIYDNGKLELGTIEGSDLNNCETIKKKYSEKLSLAYLEYTKRLKRESLLHEETSFKRIIPRVLPDIPESPKLLDLEQLISLKLIVKPNLDIFDFPTYQFDEYKRLWLSKDLIDDYKLYDECKIELNETKDDIDININKFTELFQSLEVIRKEKERLQSLISTFPEDDEEIENKMQKLSTSIVNLNQLIVLANEMKEIRKIDAYIEQLNAELKTLVDNLSHLNYFYNQTEELGMKALEKRINNINGPLKEILDDLFKEPINVKISPYKELKNGNNKLQINFQVEHRSAVVNDFGEDFSDGEEGRLSIGLLLALSRTNNNPFIIIDEVLSSMDQPKQDIVLEMLPKWAIGKFIISICHNISEGNSDNVLYF